MTTNSHRVDSKEIHKIWSAYAKVNAIQKRMNEEEYDRELTEIKQHLTLLMDLLQKRKEDLCPRWKL